MASSSVLERIEGSCVIPDVSGVKGGFLNERLDSSSLKGC